MASIDTPILSARPQMTAELMARTGLDEKTLSNLVHRFYEKVRGDAVLGRRVGGEEVVALVGVQRVDDEHVRRGRIALGGVVVDARGRGGRQ